MSNGHITQNQSYKRIYQELYEGNPTKKELISACELKAASPNLCIEWYTGREMLFFYVFLVNVEFDLQGDFNIIILWYTSQKVVLKGYLLKPLFWQFRYGKPDTVKVINPRYVDTESVNTSIVIDANIESHKL